MTWEETFAAIGALSESSLMMRKPGDWFVRTGVEIGGDGMLTHQTQRAASPEAAVREWWEQHVLALKPDRYLVVGHGEERRHYVWAGFMWRPGPSSDTCLGTSAKEGKA